MIFFLKSDSSSECDNKKVKKKIHKFIKRFESLNNKLKKKIFEKNN